MNANIFVYRCRYGICLFMNSFCLCWPTDRPLTQEGQPVAWLNRQAQRELPCKFEVGNPRTKWRFRWERHLQIGNFLASHVWGHQRRRGLQLADLSLHLLHRVLAMRSRNRVWDLARIFGPPPTNMEKQKNINIYIYMCVYQNGRKIMFLTFWRTNSNDKRVEFRWVQLRKEPRPVCFSPADPIESRKKLDRRKKHISWMQICFLIYTCTWNIHIPKIHTQCI